MGGKEQNKKVKAKKGDRAGTTERNERRIE